jgi:hypothetical protein
MAVQAMLLMAMVFVCTTIGWLIVAGPRRTKKSETAVAKAPAPVAKVPMGESERKVAARPPSAAPREKAAPTPTVASSEEPRPRPEPERPAPAATSPAPSPAPGRTALTYERHILPIVQRSCISCHGDKKRKGKLDLRSLAAARRGGESGPSVKPGNPDDSPLLETIVANRMPPGKRKLSEAEKQLIRDWIVSGAKGER